MTRALHWFRSDLRLRDNAALSLAASAADELALVFVLDRKLLTGPRGGGPRARFLLDGLERLAADLAERGQRLVVRHGDAEREIPRLLRETGADRLYLNRDYAPYATRRDAAVSAAASRLGVRVEQVKDRVVFESGELRTGQGTAFRVYTPFRNAWWRRFREDPQVPMGPLRLPPPVKDLASDPLPAPGEAGLDPDGPGLPTGGEAAARRRLDSFLDGPVARYETDRDLPALDGTSRLSPYLRLGMVSARLCVERALESTRDDPRRSKGARKWIDELIWRDFYHAILAENPHVTRGAFKPEYDAVRWNDDEEGFRAWCEGRTGFPIVDAGMRQLAATGWMHNRVRMIVASFLTKDLLVDWRRGERFFMQRLVDGDPASNNGGWQWAASTGTDAQPYFRIFNPTSQGRRWDPEGEYVRRWVPELADLGAREIHEPWRAPMLAGGYPEPILDHAERRQEALRRFEAVRRR